MFDLNNADDDNDVGSAANKSERIFTSCKKSPHNVQVMESLHSC